MNKLKTSTIAGKTTTYTYDANGNQLSSTDWRGNATTNTYDAMNRVIEKDDAYGKVIQKLVYDHNNVQVTSSNTLDGVTFNTTQYTYDKDNRLMSTTDPENHITSQGYDDVGNIQAKTDGRGITTTYNYDEFNRLKSVVNAKSETTYYTYDLNGNVLTQTDGKVNVTTFEYNVADKQVRKIDQGGRTGSPGSYTYNPAKMETYTYNADGTLAIKIDRNGKTTSYTYDVHGRLLSQSIGSQSITYTYDNNGNQLTMTDSTGTTTRTYDSLNRVLTKTVPNIGTTTFTYDVITGVPAGCTAETSKDPKNNVTTKAYDKVGRLLTVTADSKTTTYSYNDNGSRKSVVYPDGSREDYTYWNDGLDKTLTNKNADGTTIDNYSYTYDGAHNQKSKTDKKGVTSYTYDSLNRLDSVTEPVGKVTSYTYDKAGNRLTETVTDGANVTVTTYSYNEQNRLLNTITQGGGITQKTSYFYDNNGNMLSMVKSSMKPATPGTKATMTVGKVGTIAGDSSSTFYQYDVWNQLVKSVEGSSIDTYAYDGDGLRVQKAVNGVVTGYLYENDKVVLEVDGSGNQTAKNVYGTNLLTRTINGDTLYYMYNGHADVTALLKTDGTIAGTYYYDAFGNITEQTGNINNSITYAGYQYDRDTGLYYLNARYYDPTTARFITEDTFRGQANDPLSLNLYTYCHNEPIMYDDPTGHVQGFSYLTGQPTSIPSPTVKTNSAVYYNTGTNKVTTTSTQAKSNTQTQSAVYCNTGTLKLPVVSKPSVVTTTAVKSTTNAGKNVTPPSAANAKPFTPGLDGPMGYTGTSQSVVNSTKGTGNSGSSTTYNVGAIVSPSNLTTINSGTMETLAKAGKTYIPNIIKNTSLPSNIGKGVATQYL